VRNGKTNIISASATLLLFSNVLYAGGFGITVQSASGGGNAATGYVMAEDASSMWYNPALLSSVKGTQINAGISYTGADISVVNTGSVQPSAAGGFPVIGENEASPANSAIVPSFYYKNDINESYAFGLGINAPFGISTEYEKDSFARYEATESGLTVININPAISWKYTAKLHFGAGINIQHGDALLARAIDGTLVCNSIGVSDCSGFSGFSNQSTDSQVSIEASDIGYGFNLGLAYHPDESTTLSLAYRSRIKYQLEGRADFTHTELANVGEALLQTAGLADQGATADLEMPSSFSMAFASQVNDKLTLHADVTWTEWSTIPEIRVVFPDSVAGDSVTDLQWQNTIRVGAGIAYDLSDDTRIRAGIAVDPTPTPSATNRTPRAPSNDTTWYALGVGQQIDDKISLDFSMSLIVLDDYSVNYRSPGDADYLSRADVESEAFNTALSLNYKFN